MGLIALLLVGALATLYWRGGHPTPPNERGGPPFDLRRPRDLLVVLLLVVVGVLGAALFVGARLWRG